MPSVLFARAGGTDKTSSASSASSMSPLFTGGFAVVGAIVFLFLVTLAIKVHRARAKARRASARAPLLSVKGLVRVDDSAGSGKSRLRLSSLSASRFLKKPNKTASYSSTSSGAPIVPPTNPLPLFHLPTRSRSPSVTAPLPEPSPGPSPDPSPEDIIEQHIASGTLPRPFTFALTAASALPPVLPPLKLDGSFLSPSAFLGSMALPPVAASPNVSVRTSLSRLSLASGPGNHARGGLLDIPPSPQPSKKLNRISINPRFSVYSTVSRYSLAGAPSNYTGEGAPDIPPSPQPSKKPNRVSTIRRFSVHSSASRYSFAGGSPSYTGEGVPDVPPSPPSSKKPNRVSTNRRFSVSSLASTIVVSSDAQTQHQHMRKVRQAFTPVLPDELLLARTGEKLMVLQSFDDGWCVVGRERAPGPSLAFLSRRGLFGGGGGGGGGGGVGGGSSRPLSTSSKKTGTQHPDEDATEIGVVPAWCFVKPAKGVLAERPLRIESLGVTVLMSSGAPGDRDEVISWSNFG